MQVKVAQSSGTATASSRRESPGAASRICRFPAAGRSRASICSTRTTLTFPTNTLIASQTWMPAITVPAGFTADGAPVGLELVAKPYDEGTLFRCAFAFEQATHHRRAPESCPELAPTR